MSTRKIGFAAAVVAGLLAVGASGSAALAQAQPQPGGNNAG
ncbi:MAG: hypothetical protein JWO31_2624, partial [Phycisphaerales bacterium]|nr:hypothetical protein [Phycisphaerales bacterium]